MKIFDVSGGREIAATRRSGEASSNGLEAFDGDSMSSPSYRAELVKLAEDSTVGPGDTVAVKKGGRVDVVAKAEPPAAEPTIEERVAALEERVAAPG